MQIIKLCERCECGQRYVENTPELKHQLEHIRPGITLERFAEADYCLHVGWPDTHDEV